MSGVVRLAEELERGLREIPAAPLQAARRCLLDALGCGLLGSSLPEGRAILRAVHAIGGGTGAPVWGTHIELTLDACALACGALCHLRELDDVHYTILHPGAVCVPAVLAVAHAAGRTLGEVLTALTAGYEIMVRVARGSNYLEHRRLGWHGTATCGAFGAAAAVSVLLGLDSSSVAHALGLAGSRTGGTWAFGADGAMSKRLHPGLAARDGLLAAYLSREGITGPLQVLEAEDGGFFRTVSAGWDTGALTAAWGETWAIQETEFKWYASCKSVHSPVEAAIRLRGQVDRDPAAVRTVRVFVSHTAHAMAGRGYTPGSVASAQLSIPYGVAAALLGGGGGYADYTPGQLGRPEAARLASKVEVVPCLEFDRLRQTTRRSGARVVLEWPDGVTAAACVEDPRGSLYNPLDDEDLVAKFMLLASAAGAGERSRELVDAVLFAPPELPARQLSTLLTIRQGGPEDG